MNETLCPVSAKRKLYLYGMNDEQLQLMMLDIDGILTRYEATTADVLAAAQQMAVSAVGDLVNHVGGQSRGQAPGAKPSEPVPMTTLAALADAIAEQIREALHKRIDEGKRPDW